MKIKKFQFGNNITYNGLQNLDFKFQIPDLLPKPVSPINIPVPQLTPPNVQQKLDFNKPLSQQLKFNKTPSKATQIGTEIGSQVVNQLTDNFTEGLFGDSELGRGMGTLFSSGLSSAGNTITNNIIKGTTFAEGLGKNVGASVAGATAGLAANYIGKGITSLGGDSMLSRGIGQGVATGLGTVGGTALSNLVQYGSLAGKLADGSKTASLIGKGAGMINPYGLAMSVVGAGLGAAMGPSKEYGGKHGGITQGMDLAYDGIMAGINFVPGWGQIASGAMALNKGLSNIFGSTSGMTTQDAILGSAFMPAPVKWLNMAGAKTTDTFKNQSWQNSEKTNRFMDNAFGNLGDKFDKAREEAGKTYGTFSRGAYNDAQDNINFANNAWDKILAMADQNELQKIRSQYMSSINNQRYAQQIQGGWSPIARGKQGMKIFNNATNHNIGMRLLSAAALIDNKAMILCNAHD